LANRAHLLCVPWGRSRRADGGRRPVALQHAGSGAPPCVHRCRRRGPGGRACDQSATRRRRVRPPALQQSARVAVHRHRRDGAGGPVWTVAAAARFHHRGPGVLQAAPGPSARELADGSVSSGADSGQRPTGRWRRRGCPSHLEAARRLEDGGVFRHAAARRHGARGVLHFRSNAPAARRPRPSRAPLRHRRFPGARGRKRR